MAEPAAASTSIWAALGPPLLLAIIAAILAALLSGYLVARWRAREENIEKRFDEMCSTAEAIAALGSDYWAGKPADHGMILLEAKILAQFTRLAGLRVALGKSISTACRAGMESAHSDFLRAITGGDFGVHTRMPDLERVRLSQYAAAELIVRIRQARLADLRGIKRRA